MHALSSWFIRNPVAANLVMVLILVAGFFTVSGIRIEGFPKIPPDTVTITTSYTGAYTSQVDEQITRKIEKALEGLDGVKNIRSVSYQGQSIVSVQKNDDHALQKLLDDVRIRIDGIDDLPSKAKRPVITRNDFDLPALYVQVYGDTDLKTLQRLARRLREKLLTQPEISRLKVWGLQPQELKIDVRPRQLERLDITIADIVAKIRQSSLRFRTGSLKTQGGYISLRADSQAYYPEDYAKIPIRERTDGSTILLGDIATIRDGFGSEDEHVRFNGAPAVGMEILIGRKENLLEIAEVARKVTNDYRAEIPPEVSVSIWGDSSNYISERLRLLRSNAFQGLLLVLALLALFLNVRLAFWVAMGIPISVMGALAVAGSKWVDYSLNDITTFGLIIALGILVDDAVVVGESVFEERKKHPDPIVGTERGVHKVAVATIFGVLTTVAAFFPMLLINNALGKVLASFSGIVILALLFSLFESKFILPAHLAQLSLDESGPRNVFARGWAATQGLARGALYGFRDRIYEPVLVWSVKQRHAVLILFIAFAVFGIGLIAYGKIKTVFFPDIPGQIITINLQMDARAPLSLTRENVRLIEETGETLSEEYRTSHSLQRSPIEHIFIAINDASNAEIYAELSPVADRDGLGIIEVLKKWQARVGKPEGVTEITFSGSEDVGGGFVVELFAKDADLLRNASDEVKTYLAGIDGVSNVRDSMKPGLSQLRLRLKPEARHLGFSTETLATQVGYRFGGAESQKIQRDNQEVRVVVRNAEQARNTIDDLLQARLKSDTGQWIPLLAVAEIDSSYVMGYVSRRNGERQNSVQAFVDKSAVSPTEVSQALFEELVPVLKQKYPGLDIKAGGELEQEGEIRKGLVRALIFTAILIYALLAIPLKSYVQPIIIISVVPFGFVGAALGHLIMDIPLSVLSFFGMLALTGVVVNDSLVMISRYNQAREAGLDVAAAIRDSGVGRFQAIFLTTATTVAGLTPLLTETSEQAQYLIPAAVSLAFGEIFATAFTLILIPVLIGIMEDFRGAETVRPTGQERPAGE